MNNLLFSALLLSGVVTSLNKGRVKKKEIAYGTNVDYIQMKRRKVIKLKNTLNEKRKNRIRKYR